MHQSPRTVFSIRDAAVAVAVFAFAGMLISLWLKFNNDRPGHNTYCKNNMRNLAQAVDGFQSRKGGYPGCQEQLAGRIVPWPVVILPEMERLDLYREWTDKSVATPASPFLNYLVCPQDAPDQIGAPVNSYVANAGIADADNDNLANGIFLDLAHGERRLSADDIVDGKSNTLVFSENVQATTWVARGSPNTVFVWHSTIEPTLAMRINGGDLKAPLTLEMARPSSRHRGGVNVAFADTHVIFLNEEIDYVVYMHLMTSDSAKSDMPGAWRGYALNDADYH